MKKYIAEYIGTFLLVLVGTGAIVLNDVTQGAITHSGISITFGAIVFLMIVSFGKISGAHINPAVTLGLWMNKKFERKYVMPYIVVQLAGALSASLLLFRIWGTAGDLGATLPSKGISNAFFIEVVFTFLLVQSILFFSASNKFNKHIAILIGAIIFVEAFLGGPISGASMNPARSFGPAVVSNNLNAFWLYIAAPTLGSSLTLLFNARSLKRKTIK